MKFIEELSMNSYPSLQTLLYDGWILRFADGYSNRANSINPIYHSTIDVFKKIHQCEAIFKYRNLRPTYKITPFVSPDNLDALLEERGYQKIHQTSVQTLRLSSMIEPSVHSVKTVDAVDDLWFESYCKFNHVSKKNEITYRKMLNNLIPLSFFTSLYIEDEVVACGMAVIENSYIGLLGISVDEMHRNRGYGWQLMANILQIGQEKGAKTAYLQVMVQNHSAVHLYNKLGFKEEYQYWYRVL